MRRLFMPRYIIFTLLASIGLFAFDANASSRQNRQNLHQTANRQGATSTAPLTRIQPGTGEQMRRQIYRDLISSETPSLDWPAFPRIWLERSLLRYKVSNTSVGAQVPLLRSGAKLSVNFRYGLKTTFIMVSSLRKKGSKPDPKDPRVFENPVDSLTEASLVRWDEKTNSSYPAAREGYPMIAFCAFEASLMIDRNGRTDFDFFGNGQSFEKGEIETLSQTLFSNFIQVRPDISLRSYLETVCDQVFRNDVERYVIDDFAKMVSEKIVLDNPGSECRPSPDSDTLAVETGDPSCLEWHQSQFAGPIRKITIPRCELMSNGAHRCTLKARENTACPVYQDMKSGRPTELGNGRRVVRATVGHHEYPCDETQGLRCQMIRSPLLMLGQPILGGKAVCRPAAPSQTSN